jgi:hypothetical protein
MSAELSVHSLGSTGLSVLLLSTAGVAVLHTLAGPDHYLPFIVMGRARRWSVLRTVGWTVLCGVGHVGSSVLLAVAGVLLGYGLEHVQLVEEWRGSLAAWAMIAFGAVYLAWGLNRALRGSLPGHSHGHAHSHGGGHADHAHDEENGFRLTPWILFTIFVFGPCEPMIPLVMYPAAQGHWAEMWTVVTVFSALTIGAMLFAVLLARRGIALLPLHRLERYTHAVAGGVVLLAGCAIQFLGL